jgi:hypothetical protein
MAKRKKPLWSVETCPGSGFPPYRYMPGRTEPKRGPGGRVIFAKAMCEVCEKYQPVNANRRLRKHWRKVILLP